MIGLHKTAQMNLQLPMFVIIPHLIACWPLASHNDKGGAFVSFIVSVKLK
jgi:hypothetical protein